MNRRDTSGMNTLAKLLGENRVLLADGATGTNYIPLGLDSGQAPEGWNLDGSGRVEGLHRAFVEAGADVLVTNTFGGTSRRLHLHGLQDRVVEINARAAELARQATAGAGREIVIAGSVGPTGDLFEPLGSLTYDEAVEAFAEQITGLKRGGADVAWIETMSAPEEIDAAIEASIAVGLDYTVTASFDTAGHTMMGLAPAAFATMMRDKPQRPLAFGSNCGVGASDLLAAVLSMTGDAGDLPIIAKANAGVPHIHGDTVVYSGTPELMADYARLAVDAGARIIGGCCGTTPLHLALMRTAIDTHERQAEPMVHDIIARLGPLVSPPSQKVSDRQPRRRRRG
jgi:5-methyltetrahydrofolate--homocysteine methyltransferase